MLLGFPILFSFSSIFHFIFNVCVYMKQIQLDSQIMQSICFIRREVVMNNMWLVLVHVFYVVHNAECMQK